jgi:signal transduction histidine kinase/CheY-like chemotaxis protein
MNYLPQLFLLLAAIAICILLFERRNRTAEIRRLTKALDGSDADDSAPVTAVALRSSELRKLRESMDRLLAAGHADRSTRKSSLQSTLALLNGLPLAFVATESTGKIVWFSSAAERLFQTNASETRGKLLSSLVDENAIRSSTRALVFAPSDKTEAPSSFGKSELLINQTGGAAITASAYFRDISVRNALYRCFLLEDITALITESAQAESARNAAEVKNVAMHSALGALDEGVALFDANDALVFHNRGFGAIFANYDLGHSDTARFESLFESTSSEYFRAAGQSLGQPATLAAQRNLQNGKTLKVSLLRLAGGGLVSVCCDITELKGLQRQSVESKQANTLFLANLSHEIRSPLHGLLGAIDLLFLQQLSPEQQAYVELAKRAGDALRALVNQLLDFTKLDAGAIEINASVVDVRAEIDFTVRSIAGTMPDERVQWRQIVAESVPQRLMVDPVRFRQILTNLLTNAKKFTDQGVISIDVSLRGASSDPLMLETRVRDSGVGIAAADQKKLFQPFTQGNNNLSRKHGGMGLGLSIAKAVAVAMHGDISLTSLLGRGTEVKFVLPVNRVSDEAIFSDTQFRALSANANAIVHIAEPAGSDALGQSQSLTPLSGYRILLVDDSDVNLELGVAVLRKRGARVETCDNGASAILAVAAKPFDVVLMDIHMPGIDGFEAVRRIRADALSSYATVPIVAVTAHALPGDRSRCLAMGMDEYVAKPFRAEVLVATIISAVSKRRESIGDINPQLALQNAAVRDVPSESDFSLQFSRARAYVGGNEETFRKVASRLLVQLPLVVQEIRVGQDAAKMQAVVHRLSGSWSLFVEPPGQSLPTQIEQHLSTRGLDPDGALMCKSLSDEIEKLERGLRQAVEL